MIGRQPPPPPPPPPLLPLSSSSSSSSSSTTTIEIQSGWHAWKLEEPPTPLDAPSPKGHGRKESLESDREHLESNSRRHSSRLPALSSPAPPTPVATVSGLIPKPQFLPSPGASPARRSRLALSLRQRAASADNANEKFHRRTRANSAGIRMLVKLLYEVCGRAARTKDRGGDTGMAGPAV